MKKVLQEELQAARSRRGGSSPFVGELRLYCDNRACNARQVSVWLKEYNGHTPTVNPICPLCGESLEVDTVVSVEQVSRTQTHQSPLPASEFVRGGKSQ
jgi:hypothetical protein